MTQDMKARIVGMGVDMVEISRMHTLYHTYGARFLKRIYTPHEQERALRQADPVPSLAKRFAAKEAFSKALGTGFGQTLKWTQVGVVNDALGRPQLWFSEELKAFLTQQWGDFQCHLSLSDTRDIASATVLVERL